MIIKVSGVKMPPKDANMDLLYKSMRNNGESSLTFGLATIVYRRPSLPSQHIFLGRVCEPRISTSS